MNDLTSTDDTEAQIASFVVEHSVDETASVFGVSSYFVNKIIKKYNISRLSRSELSKRTKLLRYGDANYNNMDKSMSTKINRYGDAHYNNMDKNRKTCLERYGYEHHNKNNTVRHKISDKKKTLETQQKYENTCKSRYGNSNINLVPEIRMKREKSLLQKYGVKSPLQNKDIKKRQLKTLKENNSYRKSKIEEDVFNYLVSAYGENDIIRQYSDDRYPFQCDFYVKSEDLFIEVNAHPSHGGHPFNGNDPNDVAILEKLLNDNSEWSRMIIDVWSIRDVKKFEVAQMNNLNYKVIYSSIEEITNE